MSYDDLRTRMRKQSKAASERRSKPRNPNTVILSVIAVLLLCVVAIGGYFVNETQREKRKEQSDQDFNDLADYLDRVASGDFSIESQSNSIRARINDINARLASATGETRGDIVRNIKKREPTLRRFAFKIAEQSRSLVEFRVANGGVGEKALGLLSLASNTHVKDLESELIRREGWQKDVAESKWHDDPKQQAEVEQSLKRSEQMIKEINEAADRILGKKP